MRDRDLLYWIVWGGLCFWLPSVVSVALDPHPNELGLLRTCIFLPLAGSASLCAASWIAAKHPPRWGWILAGIYILGPILLFSLLASSVILRSSLFFGKASKYSLHFLYPHFLGFLEGITRMTLICLAFMIPSLLIAALGLLAMCLRYPPRSFQG